MEELRAWSGPLIAAAAFLFSIFSARRAAATAQVEKVAAAVEKLAAVVASKAADDQVQNLATKIDTLEDRTSRIEGELRHLPTRDQAHGLELALREMKGTVDVLTERLKPISATTERLQEFLVEEAKKGRAA